MAQTILDKIVASKLSEIAAARQRVSEQMLRQQAQSAPPARDFFAPLAVPGNIHLIAEVKKASPSAGVIREDFDPVQTARIYQSHGASAVSVLTDAPFFQGCLQHLQQVRTAVNLPVLRKDFILEAYQLYEARAAGADAVLLIAECLDDCQLRMLVRVATELEMTPLVEFYLPDNLSRVLDSGATVIGVNNRDLRSFQVDLDHTLRMRQQIPSDCLVVGESGIRRHEDLQRLERAGVNAVLVGEQLMRAPDIGRAVDQLLGRSDHPAI